MTRRLAIALARVPSVRPAIAVPRPRLPTARELAVAAALVGALGIGYAAARYTPLFAVSAIDVGGAPPAVAHDVRRELADLVGSSLVAVDAADVERRLAALPSVRFARVDRSFPDRLSVVVQSEQAVAVVRGDGRNWLVSESGRVIGAASGRPRLPQLRVPGLPRFERGDRLEHRGARAALRVIREVPRRFPMRVVRARPTDEGVTLVLRGWVELRVGDRTRLDAKLAAAAAVLRRLSDEERLALAYVDVTVPTRPVALSKAQVESEG